MASNITMSSPVTATFDPVAGYRFSVEIEGIVVGWFTECSGLTATRGVHPVEEGGLNAYVHQLPKRIEYSKVKLKRGVADRLLWQWFRKGLYDLKIERHTVSIILYSRDGTSATRWELAEAFPTKWTGPDFKVDSSKAAVESLEFVHHGFDMTDWIELSS